MFGSTIRRLASSLDLLRDFIELVEGYLAEKREEAVREHAPGLGPLLYVMSKLDSSVTGDLPTDALPFLEQRFGGSVQITITEDENGKNASFTVADELMPSFARGMDAFTRSSGRLEVLYHSSLMNLTSVVELFFSQVLHKYVAKFPAVLSTKDKVYSLDDLAGFQSVEDARQYYITHRIEDILYQAFADWLAFFRTNAKLSMSYLEVDLPHMLETFQRRNVVVHNSGLINQVYLAKAPPDYTKDQKVGDRLDVDRDYLFKRIDLFERNCILLASELWKKIEPDDPDRGDVLADIIYDNLKRARWRIAESLSFFLMGDKQQSESTRCVAELNYWLALKRQNKLASISEEVKTADYSARSLRFQLALLSLKDDMDGAFAILEKALGSGDLTLEELAEFPILEPLRLDPRYAAFRPDSGAPQSSAPVPETVAPVPDLELPESNEDT